MRRRASKEALGADDARTRAGRCSCASRACRQWHARVSSTLEMQQRHVGAHNEPGADHVAGVEQLAAPAVQPGVGRACSPVIAVVLDPQRSSYVSDREGEWGGHEEGRARGGEHRRQRLASSLTSNDDDDRIRRPNSHLSSERADEPSAISGWRERGPLEARALFPVEAALALGSSSLSLWIKPLHFAIGALDSFNGAGLFLSLTSLDGLDGPDSRKAALLLWTSLCP